MFVRARSRRRSLALAALVIASLAATARAQRPGEPAPPDHPPHAVLAHPVYTAPSMVLGTWETVALAGATTALSGEPRPYEVAISDGEVAISSPKDPYGTRTFGIVRARAVETWVEYELRGQGGIYFLTAQLGARSGGGHDAVFVLSPPGAAARIERFIVPTAIRDAEQAAAAERVDEGRPRTVGKN